MRDYLTSSGGGSGGVYTPFSKNVDKFIEQLKAKNPNSQGPSRAPSPSPSMHDWKVIASNQGTYQGTLHEEISLLRSDAYRSPSPSVSGQDTAQVLEWQNAKRNPSTNLTQLMCEGCSFCITVAGDEESALSQLNRRFENRCPMTLFSQMAGIGAGSVSRSDAYSFLQQRGWKSEEISELLDRLDMQGTGDIDREHLVRSYDAVMCEESGDRNIPNAIALTFQQRRFAFQYHGSVVQPKDAPSPDRWHEQACCHLGLKGFVRLCRVGLLLEIGISLQGQRDDIRAYVDAFMVSSVSGNTDSMVLPIRRLGKDEVRMAELKVTMHHSSKELSTLHKADLARSNAPVGPPAFLSEQDEVDDDEIAEPETQSPHLADSVHAPTRIRSEPLNNYVQAQPMPVQEAPRTVIRKDEGVPPESRGSSPSTSPIPCPPHKAELNGHRRETVTVSRTASPPAQRVLYSSSGPRSPTADAAPSTPQPASVSLAQGSVSPPGRNAAALYDYQAVEDDELSIYTGQVLQVISRHDDGWVLVQNSQGRFGVVPGNYLAMMEKALVQPRPGGLSQVEGGSLQVAVQGRRAGGVFTEALTAGASAGTDFEAKLRELEGMLSTAGGELFSKVTACRKTVEVTLAALAESRDHRSTSSAAATPGTSAPPVAQGASQPARAANLNRSSGVSTTLSPTTLQPRSPAPLAHGPLTRSPSPDRDVVQRASPAVGSAGSVQRIEMSKRSSLAGPGTVLHPERGGLGGARVSPTTAAAVYEQRAREGFLNDFDDSSESESSDDSVGWRPRSRLSRLGMHASAPSADAQAPPARVSASHHGPGGRPGPGSASAAVGSNSHRDGSQVRSAPRRAGSAFRGGDVSDESDSDDSDDDDDDDRPGYAGRAGQALQASPPDVPKLNLSKVGGGRLPVQHPPMPLASVGGAVNGSGDKHWRVYVQLIEGRDIGALAVPGGRGASLSAFCCLSLLQGQQADARWLSSVEHEVGGISGAAGRGALRLAPQQTTRPSRQAGVPSWNQGFVFADAYPSTRALGSAGGGGGRMLGVGDRETLRGGEVLLLLTVHDAGEAPGIGGSLLGRASLQVSVGHPADHWVPVKPRDGASAGRDTPAVHLRVAYGSSSFGASPSTAMGPNSGFWA